MTRSPWFRLGLPALATAVLAGAYLATAAALDPALVVTPAGWLPGALALVQAGVLVARERWPLPVLAVVVVLDLVGLVVSAGEIGTGGVAVLVAVYTVARRRGPLRWGAAGAVAVAEVAVATIAVQGSDEVPGILGLPFAALRVVVFVAAPFLVADTVTSRELLVAAWRERAEAAERDRESRARAAVARERTAMARELHDVAAHHLTGIVVSAQAAGSLLVRDPGRARVYLATVERDARTTLANLRQTVGLLRGAPGDRADLGELAPVPSLDAVPQLVAEAGPAVTLEVSGEPGEVGPLAGVAAYRMVQESLANAARHAPGTSRHVGIHWEEASVTVTVENGPAAPSAPGREGYGLLGMAERAALVGGRLATGPTPGGGWRNELELPVERDAP